MAATGSRAAESTELADALAQGYSIHAERGYCRIVDPDPTIHSKETEGRFWSRSPFGDSTKHVEWYSGRHLRPAPVTDKAEVPGWLQALTDAATGAAEKSSPAPVEKPTAVTDPAPVVLPPKVQRAPKGRPSKFQYLEALRDAHDLTHAEFHLLTVLLTYADADLTNARPGHTRLAVHMGYSAGDPRQVRKLLDSLERKGYVEVQEPGTNTGSRRATTYRLTLPIRQE